jgi:hypothetical protein
MSVNSKMTAIADAIRSKTGGSDALTLDDMAVAITSIETGIELPELTNEGSASDLLSGKELIDSSGNIVTGTIETKNSSNLAANGATVTVPAGYYASQATKSVATATQATPSVSIDSTGKITATATQTEGYVSAGTKTGTKQLTTQAAKTITPSKSSQTAVAKDVYTTGAVTVAAIPNEYITTSDATAAADEIMSGETAYVNGSKVTGTFTIDNELTAQDNLISQIQSALEGKAAGGEPVLQSKTVNPSTSSQTIKPDSGYDGLSQVTVNAMATATQATPSISVSTSGVITATATQTAGYVAAGTKTGTKQLTTQAAKTITPSTSSQTAVNSGVYTTGKVTVNPIPSSYVIPSGTKTITTNGTHDVKAYASATVNIAGEDVTSETNAYTTKLASLETAITALETELQGKASGGSGGGSVETCTVSITSHMQLRFYSYTAYRDGQFVAVAASDSRGLNILSIELTDVVCGSVIMVGNGYTFNGFTVSGGVEYLGNSIITVSSMAPPFKAPSISGSHGIIDIFDNDY